MSAWLAAVIALLLVLAIPGWVGLRGDTADRLVAVQLASGIGTLILVLMSFAFDQSSYLDLALTLSFLSLPGTLIMALFLERWV